MMRAQRVLSLLVLPAVSAVGAAQDGDPADLPIANCLATLTGKWEGELTYLDYQSGDQVALPAFWNVQAWGDGRWLVSQMAFQDPGRMVRSLSVSWFDDRGESLISQSVSSGEADRETLQVLSVERRDADDWEIVLSGRGTDDGRPAEFRITRRLVNQTFTSAKAVRYTDGGAGDDDWLLRNTLTVRRAPPPTLEAMVGTWRADLRPTPDADPYYATLEITAASPDGVEGTFYDTPIREVCTNTAWGVPHLSFVTNDGSCDYYTTVRLGADGTLRGTTHAVQRGFTSAWRAERG
ncbi:MAG: hypothetical protein AAF628_33330 [Planctomycetota bacterium]